MKAELSVILATRDRARTLESTLEHFRRQPMAGVAWEVIVVDNGSRDDTPTVLANAARHLPLVSLHVPVPGKPRSLNKALDVAQGNLLVFTDDDVVPVPDWLPRMLAAAATWKEGSIFGGPVIPLLPEGYREWEWLCDHPFASYAFARFSYDLPEGPTSHLPFGPNYAVRAGAMQGTRFSEDIGSGSQYGLGTETEMLRRLYERGERIIYVPEAAVRHLVRPEQLTYTWLFQRSYRRGRITTHLNPDLASPRVMGVPLPMLLKLPVAWALSGLGRLAGRTLRLETGLNLHRLRGRLHEYRQMRTATGEGSRRKLSLAERHGQR